MKFQSLRLLVFSVFSFFGCQVSAANYSFDAIINSSYMEMGSMYDGDYRGPKPGITVGEILKVNVQTGGGV
jgi:hypothetical protein